jgi:hypothetical protein
VELLLHKIEAQGRQFLMQIDDQFRHPPGGLRTSRRSKSERLAVTVFAHRESSARRRRVRG